MKKRIVSIMLVLTFVLLALPMSVSAGEAHTGSATYTSKLADWTAKVGTISALDGGVFKMDATTNNVIKLAMWNGSLYEGRISMTFDYGSIAEADRGPAASNPGTGANDTGIIFGGKGLKASTATSANGIQSDDKTYFYFLYFSKSTLNLARVDNELSGAERADDWCGTIKDTADNSDLKYDINKSSAPQEYKDMWAAAKTSGKIEVSLAWSSAGAIRVWVNGVHIKEFDGEAGTAVPYGPELGVRNGVGHDWDTKIYDFKVYGGLDIKSHVGTVNYDPINYKWSASKDNGGQPYDSSAVVGYVTNRVVTDGKIVIMAQQVPDVIHTSTKTAECILDDNGVCICRGQNKDDGTGEKYPNHYQNYYTGAVFNVTADGKNYYMLSMKDTQSTKGGALGPGAVSIQTRLSAVIDGKWTADPTGVAWKVVQHVNSNPYSPADPITFNASTGKITWPSGTTTAFNGTNASTYKVSEWTNPTPITGGFYGFRSDVYDDAYQAWVDSMNGKWPSTSPAVNANDGAWVQYYVVNNEKEAIDLSLSTGNLDLTNVEKNKEYSVTVSTFPAGSVVNSGETVELVGNGIKTVSTKDNGNGTYTVKFRATKDGAVDIAAQVNNHIFGTLTSNAASATVVDTGVPGATGDATFLIGAGAALMAILGTAIVIGKKRTVA